MIPIAPVGAIASVTLRMADRDDGQLFLGKDLLPWLLLAFGAAMVVGNVAALLRPPPDPAGGGLPAQRPSVGRALGLIVIGSIAAVWAFASLVR